ncbi:MAG: hypothetical protein LBU70_05330 [Chitinispirillales bacterium]|nr:hypothetical protein [Chitinispirillales bacterium]
MSEERNVEVVTDLSRLNDYMPVECCYSCFWGRESGYKCHRHKKTEGMIVKVVPSGHCSNYDDLPF